MEFISGFKHLCTLTKDGTAEFEPYTPEQHEKFKLFCDSHKLSVKLSTLNELVCPEMVNDHKDQVIELYKFMVFAFPVYKDHCWKIQKDSVEWNSKIYLKQSEKIKIVGSLIPTSAIIRINDTLKYAISKVRPLDQPAPYCIDIINLLIGDWEVYDVDVIIACIICYGCLEDLKATEINRVFGSNNRIRELLDPVITKTRSEKKKQKVTEKPLTIDQKTVALVLLHRDIQYINKLSSNGNFLDSFLGPDMDKMGWTVRCKETLGDLRGNKSKNRVCHRRNVKIIANK